LGEGGVGRECVRVMVWGVGGGGVGRRVGVGGGGWGGVVRGEGGGGGGVEKRRIGMYWREPRVREGGIRGELEGKGLHASIIHMNAFPLQYIGLEPKAGLML